MMYKIIRFVIVLVIITNAYSAVANKVTVSNLNDDSNLGSLRWAIETANSDVTIDQIDFVLGLTGTITLTSDLPFITKDVNIIGPGAIDLTISGDNKYSMFYLANGITLTISGLTLTQNKSGSGTIFNANNSNFIASGLEITQNNNSSAFFSANNSTITISNSTFTNNGSNLFGSDYGSTPSITSDVATDYTNRITVTGSTFTGNTGVIFSTERYVKIDTCVFTANTQQIGSFRGVNRYQVLNSTFTNNTGYQLFSFSSWIGGSPSWGESTLAAYNTLFDGNTFTGNTGTIINPGGSADYDNKTTISNNVFINNGTSYTGTPAVVSNNTLDNFITSVTHSLVESTLIVTMSRPVYNTSNGSGALEASDFEFLLTGGNATLISSTPSSISVNGNVYTLGIALSGEISGAEKVTVRPVVNSIYDGSNNVAGITQQNSTINLNFLDDDADGVSNFSDRCPNTSPGVRVYLVDGCEDTTYPFITHYNYGSTFNYPSTFVSTTNHTLYFISYDSNWNSSINKLTPEKVISTLFTPTGGSVQYMTTDASDNLHFVYYDFSTSLSEIRKVTSNGITSLLLTANNEYINDLIADDLGNIFFVINNYNTNSSVIKKLATDGTVTIIDSDSVGYFQNLVADNLGNIYFVINNYNPNSSTIKKWASDGTITELNNTNDYVYNLKVDFLGNIYFFYDNPTNNSYGLNKLTSTGTVSNLYSISDGSIESIAVDVKNNLYFVTYDFSTGRRKISAITPEGIIVSYGDFTGSQLYNDRSGTIYFDDYVNKKIMTNKPVQLSPMLSNFDAIDKYYFDGSYTITPPTSNSLGAFTYTSSNTNVATVNGTIVTIVGTGTTTITATQAADGLYSSDSISAILTVNSVTVVAKNGGITSTDVNYVNKNGAINSQEGLSSNGAIKRVKTQEHNALNFSSSLQNYASLPPGTYFSGDFTIECWVYPTSFSNWSRIIDFGNGAGNNNVLFSVTDGTSGMPGFYVGGTQFRADMQIPLNQWTHLAATLSGNTATIYINGVASGVANFPTPANIIRNDNYIGRSNWGWGDPAPDASFDDLRIWSVAKTSTEILASMNRELSGSESNLVAYFKFNQGVPCGNNTAITTLTNSANTGAQYNANLHNFTQNNNCSSNFVAGKLTN